MLARLGPQRRRPNSFQRMYRPPPPARPRPSQAYDDQDPTAQYHEAQQAAYEHRMDQIYPASPWTPYYGQGPPAVAAAAHFNPAFYPPRPFEFQPSYPTHPWGGPPVIPPVMPFSASNPYPAPFQPTPPAYHPSSSSNDDNWRKRNAPWEQGQANSRWQSRRDGGQGSMWSTGDYKPLVDPARPSSSSSRGPPRQGSRSPSPQPYAPNDPSRGDRSASPRRRQKFHVRSDPVRDPSQAYLDACSSTRAPSSSSSATNLPETSTSTSTSTSTPREPMLLILDLNHTLLCRATRNRAGSKLPLVRPYLSTFLEYICTATSPASSTSPRTTDVKYLPIVFSSARYQNVMSLLVALNLVARSQYLESQRGGAQHRHGRERGSNEDQDEVLELIWTREDMGLSERDFRGDVETTKDLEGVWKALGLGRTSEASESEEEEGQGETRATELEKRRNEQGARRTILLDDEASKAAQHPHSHLSLSPFLIDAVDFPTPPPFRPTSATDVFIPTALALDESHPVQRQDRELLRVVYVLDQLSKEENIGRFLKNGGYDEIEREVEEAVRGKDRGDGRGVDKGEVKREMERRGEDVAREAGVEVRREWDPSWRDRVVERRRRAKGE